MGIGFYNSVCTAFIVLSFIHFPLDMDSLSTAYSCKSASQYRDGLLVLLDTDGLLVLLDTDVVRSIKTVYVCKRQSEAQ